MNIIKLILMRHGKSQWNSENRFTGWTDIDLSDEGREEAKKAGRVLKEKGYVFDLAYTSVLKRAIHTLWIVLDELDQAWIPVEKSWRLNERHYGALQGLNKTETVKKYGNQQVKEWRRGLEIMPPALSKDDQRYPGYDMRYANLTAIKLPTSESLALTINRVIPYWNQVILPHIKDKKKIIIVAHGNSIRAIVKFFDNLSKEEIVKLNIPTSVPLVYEFNSNVKPIKHYYLW